MDVDCDAAAVESLKAGTALKVKATADGGQEIVFPISLDGFASACGRLVTLMKP